MRHAFNGVHPNISCDGMRYVSWRGSCICGMWVTSTCKTTAWERVGDHVIPHLLRQVPPPPVGWRSR